MSSNNKPVDNSTSVTNSLIPESSSSSETASSSSSNWDKTDYSSFRSEKHTNHNEDALSSTSGSSSSSSRQDRRHRGGFQVDILSSEPEDFDESGHLFHLDIMKNSLSDISLPSSRKVISGKPKQPQNLSFSRERVREIERHNQLLLQRIMTTKPTLTTKPKSTVPVVCTPVNNNSRTTSAAVNRKKQQRQIDIDNQLLRKKLEKIERTRRNAW
ncbi:protein hemingway-like [Ochlerotatus camptorhynchus]|uniref:protein hemingway-like n=1 Tax=Ochlerotatus camptorhynchus TaxID=644619 RepID=UPI0031DAB6CE